MWRKKGSAHDLKHTSSSVKHRVGSVMACTCMAASGVGSLISIDDVTAELIQKSTKFCKRLQ